MNPAMVQKMIQANERGNPKMSGVADEKNVYPGQTRNRLINTITIKKLIRAGRIDPGKSCFRFLFLSFFFMRKYKPNSGFRKKG